VSEPAPAGPCGGYGPRSRYHRCDGPAVWVRVTYPWEVTPSAPLDVRLCPSAVKTEEAWGAGVELHDGPAPGTCDEHKETE